MKNIHQALVKYNFHSAIKVSSPIALSALQSSYPSSAGSFRTELIQPVFKPMFDFLRETGSFLMVNAYPFFAYESNSDVIPLDYALFRENPGVVDAGNGLRYFSLFDAQIDAVFAAMSALKYDDLRMVVTETGWPSKGDENELGASVENAAAYNGNLVRRILTGGLKNYHGHQSPVTGGQPVSTPGNRGGVSKSTTGNTWCVANGEVGKEKLQAALDFACGEGKADCRPIQPGSSCYDPNTLEAHASFAFNSYYQKMSRAGGSCYFGGAAHVVTQPPKYGACELPTGY
ncbi:hypothetical protein Patl1_01944 [Pistacia atlantica]|uniref:Uncharacterized protein n=1 Tax=Pistacia atlantica TaxID=434234 RepID=A0ACC1C558_9ROSI|nr:hypothetical protein Patl1_01944 [Pistacia atlantica]